MSLYNSNIPSQDIFFHSRKVNSKILLLLLMLMAGLAIVVDHIGRNNLFIISVALISLLLLCFFKQKNIYLDYLIVCIPYFIVNYKFLFSSLLPIRDSWHYHFTAFKYIGDIITGNYNFPLWIPVSGGVRIGFFHIQLFTTLPHRVIGYFLYLIMPMFPVFIYKLQYMIGIVIMCFGWWLVLQKITQCRYSAYFGTLMIMMGGTGITFHQEQVVATTYLIPWFILSLLKIRGNSYYIFPAVVIFGLGLNTHNIQIQFISMGLLVLLIILLQPFSIRIILKERWWHLLPLLLLFILAILPSYYLFKNINILSTTVRGSAVGYFHPRTYEEYLSFSTGNFASAIPSYYSQYIKPVCNINNVSAGLLDDRFAFFVGRIALIFAIFGLFLKPKKSIPVFVLLIIFMAFTLGVNCAVPIPKLFYYIHFPFMDVFRQWYHFFPMINFCLSVLSAIGISSLIQDEKYKKKRIWFALFLLFFQIIDLAKYDVTYCSNFVRKDKPPELSSYLFAKENHDPTNIFQYKSRHRLYNSCYDGIITELFLTNNILSVTGGVDKEIEEITEVANKGECVVVVNAPKDVLHAFSKFSTKIAGDSRVYYNGLLLDVSIPDPSFLVTPLNYDLGLRVYIDGKEDKVWRVNGALSGIIVKEGTHKIRFKLKNDMYLFIVWIQLLLYVLLGLFFYKLFFKNIRKEFNSTTI